MMCHHRRPPHSAFMAILLLIVLVTLATLGEQGEVVTEAITELLTPLGVFLLPILLLVIIQLLSFDDGSVSSALFPDGEPGSIHRVSGSSVGIACLLVFFLVLLYNRMNSSGGRDGPH